MCNIQHTTLILLICRTMWALSHTPQPLVLLCKYSLCLLLLVHSASSFDTQPVVTLPPCSSSQCNVTAAEPAMSAASETSEPLISTETVNSTGLIVVFKVSRLKVFCMCLDHARLLQSPSACSALCSSFAVGVCPLLSVCNLLIVSVMCCWRCKNQRHAG